MATRKTGLSSRSGCPANRSTSRRASCRPQAPARGSPDFAPNGTTAMDRGVISDPGDPRVLALAVLDDRRGGDRDLGRQVGDRLVPLQAPLINQPARLPPA